LWKRAEREAIQLAKPSVCGASFLSTSHTQRERGVSAFEAHAAPSAMAADSPQSTQVLASPPGVCTAW
jgi:hypothetical protein